MKKSKGLPLISCLLPVFQTRQPVFVQLLQGVFRVYHCNWLNPVQKASVEACIKVLSDVGKIFTPDPLCHFCIDFQWKYLFWFGFSAKSRAIAIPVDLDSQVNNLFVKSNNVVQKSILNWRLSAKNTSRRDSGITTSKDYRNIIERLQVSQVSSCIFSTFLYFIEQALFTVLISPSDQLFCLRCSKFNRTAMTIKTLWSFAHFLPTKKKCEVNICW